MGPQRPERAPAGKKSMGDELLSVLFVTSQFNSPNLTADIAREIEGFRHIPMELPVEFLVAVWSHPDLKRFQSWRLPRGRAPGWKPPSF